MIFCAVVGLFFVENAMAASSLVGIMQESITNTFLNVVLSIGGSVVGLFTVISVIGLSINIIRGGLGGKNNSNSRRKLSSLGGGESDVLYSEWKKEMDYEYKEQKRRDREMERDYKIMDKENKQRETSVTPVPSIFVPEKKELSYYKDYPYNVDPKNGKYKK